MDEMAAPQGPEPDDRVPQPRAEWETPVLRRIDALDAQLKPYPGHDAGGGHFFS
jgi:hypothetical protein